MTTVNLSVEQCHTLAFRALRANGCDEPNARAIADVMSAAERDFCHSRGLFRLPLYLGALKSGKVNGSARPTYERLSPSVLQVQGDRGFVPLAQQVGREPLTEAAHEYGIAALSIVRTYHFRRYGMKPRPWLRWACARWPLLLFSRQWPLPAAANPFLAPTRWRLPGRGRAGHPWFSIKHRQPWHEVK